MTRGRPKKIDQQHVVEVAMTLYWAEGLRVSLNEICRQAGIAKTSFYREFGSEDYGPGPSNIGPRVSNHGPLVLGA